MLISVQTPEAGGTAYAQFAAQWCQNGNGYLLNDTGTSLDVKIGATGDPITIAAGAGLPFALEFNCNELFVRRTDQATTQVLVKAQLGIEGDAATLLLAGEAISAAVRAHDASATAHGLTASALGSAPPEMWVWDDGAGAVFVRWAWDATNDLLLKINKVSSVGPNGLANFEEFGTVLASSEIGGTPTVAVSWESIQDDVASFSTAANGRAGGNHSAQIVKVTKAAHGLTNAAIGKRFSDGTDNFVITHVPDAGYFYVIGAPKTIVTDTGGTLYVPAADSITGLDGQGNLSGCEYSFTEDVPSVRGKVQSFLVDGRALVAGEIARCSKLEIAEYHEAINVRGAYAYFVATGEASVWGSAAQGAMWRRTIRYTIFPWRQVSIDDHTVLIADGVRFNNTPPLQHNPMLPGVGEYRHIWIPGAGSLANKSWNGSAQTVDLNSPKYHTSNGLIDFSETDTRIANVPVDHIAEIIAPSSATIDNWTRFHLAGTSPVYFDGIPANRLAQSDDSNQFQIGSAPKFYEYLRHDFEKLAAGTAFKSRGFRLWGAKPTGLDMAAVLQSGSDWLVYIAWRTAAGSKEITLPAYVPLRTASQVRALNGSLTALSAGVLTINQTADAGMLIVRLS